MKKIINNIFLMCSLVLLVLGACSDEDKFMGITDEIVVTATMPDDGATPNHGTLKSVAVSSDDNTLNLITKWKSGDKIQVFVRQDNKVYKVSEVSTVYNISSNGKTCSFNFKLPSSIDGARVYDVIGVTGISAQAADNEVVANSTLMRVNLNADGEAVSPMWFVTAKTNTATNFQAQFQHLGTYEILHVTNTSGGDLTFRHLGFDVSDPWFKYHDNTMLNNTYDPTAHFTEPGDAESPALLIKAGKTGKILSWYIPSGSLMEGAKLRALINGKNVTSSNTKSSALPIQRGKAYHMYATWDGKQLKFDDSEHGVAEGLVAYYPFNGNANDESGNGNNGILCGTNPPELTSDRHNKENSAYYFGGFNNFNYIQVPNSPSLIFDKAFTISVWFQNTEFIGMDGWGRLSDTDMAWCIISKAGDGNATYPGLYILSAKNANGYSIGTNNSNGNSHYSNNVNHSISFLKDDYQLGEWLHLVLVVDDTSKILYINGVEVARDDLNLEANFSSMNSQDFYFGTMAGDGMTLGGLSSGAWYPFLGKMDDIRIYNRGLSNAEIRSLYNE